LLWVILACVLATTARAATAGWTVTQAQARVKSTYSIIDPKAYAVVKANLDQAIAGGEPQATIDHLRSLLLQTLHAATVRKAVCKGVGKAVHGRYGKFHCTVTLVGMPNMAPGYVTFTATQKLTVTVKDLRIISGWR